MADFSYELIKHVGVIGTYPSGWKKEINVISWNGGEPKVDIRDWSENHEKMNKGVTLKKEEAMMLVELMKGEFYDED